MRPGSLLHDGHSEAAHPTPHHFEPGIVRPASSLCDDHFGASHSNSAAFLKRPGEFGIRMDRMFDPDAVDDTVVLGLVHSSASEVLAVKVLLEGCLQCLVSLEVQLVPSKRKMVSKSD